MFENKEKEAGNKQLVEKHLMQHGINKDMDCPQCGSQKLFFGSISDRVRSVTYLELVNYFSEPRAYQQIIFVFCNNCGKVITMIHTGLVSKPEQTQTVKGFFDSIM